MTGLCQTLIVEQRTAEAALLTEVLVAVSHIGPLVEQFHQRLAADAGLSAAGWQVLSVLGDDTATVPQLADRLGRRRQTVQVAVDALTELGHVNKQPNPHHARSTHIVITAQGLRAYWDTVERHVAWTNHHAESFDHADLQAAARLVPQLQSVIAKELDRSVAASDRHP